MMIECKKHKLNVENQVKIDVFYENINVGQYFADLVVENKIVIELKAVSQINNAHYAQLLHYLKSTNFRLGYLHLRSKCQTPTFCFAKCGYLMNFGWSQLSAAASPGNPDLILSTSRE